MTNAETILKLNEALSTLIKAYEELQEDNTNLKSRINELEDEVLELESAKEDLEKNVDEFKDHTQKDKSNISTMLGKIESILNKKSSTSTSSTNSVSTPNTSATPEVPKEKIEDKKDDIFSASVNPTTTNSLYDNKKEEPKEESNSNKIDLNRMASLLNGFNH